MNFKWACLIGWLYYFCNKISFLSKSVHTGVSSIEVWYFFVKCIIGKNVEAVQILLHWDLGVYEMKLHPAHRFFCVSLIFFCLMLRRLKCSIRTVTKTRFQKAKALWGNVPKPAKAFVCKISQHARMKLGRWKHVFALIIPVLTNKHISRTILYHWHGSITLQSCPNWPIEVEICLWLKSPPSVTFDILASI